MQNSWSQIIRTSFSASLAAKIAFVTLSMRTKWYLLIHGVYQKGSSIPFPSIMFLADPQQGPERPQKKKSQDGKGKRHLSFLPYCSSSKFPLDSSVFYVTWSSLVIQMWLQESTAETSGSHLSRHLNSDRRASHFLTLFPTILCGCC